jgi:hypothetical protein
MVELSVEEIEKVAKDVMDSSGSHSPQLMLETKEGVQCYVLIFEADDEKEKMCEMMRYRVNSLGIDRYWIVMETWLGGNPFVRPSMDKDRVEALLVQEVRRDLCNITIINRFSRDKNEKIVWGNRDVVTGSKDFHSQWNFFIEDDKDGEVWASIRVDYAINMMKKSIGYKDICDSFRKEFGREVTDDDLRKVVKKFFAKRSGCGGVADGSVCNNR